MKVVRVFVLTIMAIWMMTTLRAQTNANAIVGAWESDQKDVRMEFFEDGDHYSARLLWGNKIVERDNITSKKDVKNPDPGLRSRNIIGIVSLTGLKWDGKEYMDGKIYDPPSGKTYNCKAWMEGDKLQLRGFLGFSMMGRTVSWHRYASNLYSTSLGAPTIKQSASLHASMFSLERALTEGEHLRPHSTFRVDYGKVIGPRQHVCTRM